MGDEDLLFRIWDAISTSQQGSLNRSQIYFCVIWELEAEVNNGGFHQYFFNGVSSGTQLAPYVLQEIGAAKCSDLVSRALEAVNPDATDWDDDDVRQAYLDGLDQGVRETLDGLDEEFFTYPDNLSDLLTKFVHANRSDFAI